MKRILIFSDTHGNTDPCIRAVESAGRVDAIIHAGDYTRDAEDISYIYPGIPVYYVRGNNDIFARAEDHMLVTIDGISIYITHGHNERVKYEMNYTTLRERVTGASPDLVVFGHTHIPYSDDDGKMKLLNPGSVRYSKTYAIAEIDRGEVKTRIVDI